MCASFLTGLVSKKIGRKSILMSGDLICGILLLVLGFLTLLNRNNDNTIM